MNYLAHAWVLERRTPGLVLGTALPDLVGAWDRRAPRLFAPRFEEAGEHELARGIRAHQAADVSFHGLEAFSLACGAIKSELASLKGERRLRLFFVAHVLLEILLDATIVEREPGFGDAYYEALAAAPVSRVASVLELPDAFADFVGRFTRSRFLLDYGTDEGVARRLEQVLARGRQVLGDAAQETLRDSLPRLRELIRERFPELTLGPRAAANVGL